MVMQGQTDTPEVDVILNTEEKETPKEEPVKVETFTREQVDKQVRDARSAALADIGRYKVESERALKAAQAAQTRVDKLLKEQEQAELEAARDDPERMTLVQERQKRRDLESKLDSAQSELTTKDERLKALEAKEAEITKAQQAATIATQYKVDPAYLMQYTDGSAEKMEGLAKVLSKTDRKPLKTDSGKMVGGKLTFEDVRAEFIKNPRGPYRDEYLRMRNERKT